MMRTRIKLILEYDGSRYDGWQKQGNTKNTIQGKIEQVLERMTGSPVEVRGAGRTDAGVHALGQTADFRLEGEYETAEVMDYLNRYLPEDIRALSAERVEENFHSRLLAVSKWYRYRLWTGKKKPVFERKYLYQLEQELDLQAMEQAAVLLEGCHDFRSFCSNKKMKKSTVRTVRNIQITQEGDELILDFYGDGFLYHMVRILVGTLIEVGEGKRRPEEMSEILQKKDRQAAGFTAPAEGLCLMNVEYGGRDK